MREKHLDLTLTKAELALIRAAADQEGLSAAAWLRRLALQKAREESK